MVTTTPPQPAPKPAPTPQVYQAPDEWGEFKKTLLPAFVDTAKDYADTVKRYTPTQVIDNLPSGQSVLDTLSAPFSFFFNTGKSAASALDVFNKTAAPAQDSRAVDAPKTVKDAENLARKNAPNAPPAQIKQAGAQLFELAKRGQRTFYAPKPGISSSALPWIIGIGAVVLLGVGVIAISARD